MLLSEAPIQPQLLAKIQVALPSRRLVPGRLLRIAASALVTVGLIWAASSYITKTSSPPPVAKIISDPGTAIGPSRHEGPIALTSIEELRERYPLIARVETEGARYYQDTAEDGTRLVFFYVPEI